MVTIPIRTPQDLLAKISYTRFSICFDDYQCVQIPPIDFCT